jgi:glutamate dehydrogenase (NADP+)
VGGREIGFLFGQYKRLRNEFTGVLTGKGLAWGGSLIRPEATGYGCVYFAEEMLKTKKDKLEGKSLPGFRQRQRLAIHHREAARSGREAGHAVRFRRRDLRSRRHRPREAGLRHGPEEQPRGRIKEYADKFKKAIYMPTDIKLDHNPLWNIKADCAFPSATQNEINAKDAANLIKNGVKVVSEGANMPSTLEATKMFLDAKVLYGPAKAANAGGVATSGLEMSQNSMR